MGIHQYDKKVKSAVKLIKKTDKISERNKELILQFKSDLEVEGIGNSRIHYYMMRLYKTAQYINKDFDKVTLEDIKKFVAFIHTTDIYKDSTKKDYKIGIKRFYKWLEGDNKVYPEKVSWIKSTIRNEKKKLPEEILSKEDIKKLILNTNNARDKALVSMLYESGCRVGELLELQIKHIEWIKYGVKITVNGKTGMRKILIIESIGYLKSWLDNHPDNSNGEALLWVNISNHNNGKRIEYRTIREMLKRIAAKSGLGILKNKGKGRFGSYQIYEGKGINPHAFRHSRATHLATKLTESQLCQFFGWRIGSDMPARYVHLSGRDLDSSILSIYGIKEEKEVEKEFLICPRCRVRNETIKSFCADCGMPLSLEAAMENEEQRNKYDNIMSELFKKLLSEKEVKIKAQRFLEEIMGE